MAGRWIQEKGKEYEGLTKLLLAGVLSVVIALSWDWFFPINKKLWTGSFVFLTVGVDCILIAALIYITDVLQNRKWGYFFEVFGKNPLFIYLLSELGVTLLYFFRVGDKHQPLYVWIFQTIYKNAGMYFGSFLFAVSVMLVCWLVGYVLDKRKIYVRV
jgi:predicted acyltransferase